MTRKPIFARLATSARLKQNQSPLFRWFLQHHDEFAAVLAKIRRPGWQSIAVELTAEGLTRSDGEPISGAYARQAWWRADRAYRAKQPEGAAMTAELQPSPAAPALTPAPHPTPAADPPPAIEPIEDKSDARPKFRRAGGFAKRTTPNPEQE